MKYLFWVTVNLIGFIILIFMYSHTDKTLKKNPGQILFGYLQIILMLYLFFDTGMYLLEGMTFSAARPLNYAFSLIYYLLTPLPGLIFFLFCDYKIFNNIKDLKKRFKYYLIPASINALAVFLTPFTNMLFYIDENNIYSRGGYFWVTLTVGFGYFAAYLLLSLKQWKKTSLSAKGPDIYLFLFPIPPVIFAIIQTYFYGILLLGIGYVISAYYLYTNIIQSSEDKRKLSVRFNNINIAHFAIVAFIMITGMLFTLENIIKELSHEYSNIIHIKLILPFAIIIFLFITFVFSTYHITQQLIFNPLKLLVDSLLAMRENNKEEIYGLDRDDEIGLLSNTIHDLFVKGHYDGLTGIYNRRYMEMTMRQIIMTFSRTNSKLSVLMLDVDFFKDFNDTYGHSKGDECLKAIANALIKNIARKVDFAARYGGEEFTIVLPGVNEKGALIVAEKLLDAIRKLNIPHEKSGEGIVTISIGVTTGLLNHTQDWNDYIKKADEALYMSKQNGRNRRTFLKLDE